MYTSLAKLWGYTSLAAIVIIGTANLNISFAGGDPNVKDKKIYQTKSNIKQQKKELLEYLSRYWECSQNEVREYLNFLEDDEVLRILNRMGVQQKEINKLL